jgi:precorrin-6Y C5,15-methyltransferase (decarboxylating)
VVWDIGAGSGSVAIEAAQLASSGMVYAIETDVADYHLIVANAQTFGVKNLTPIHGLAPAVFAGLPAPDAVFVGGIRQEASRLLDAAFQALRPGGRLVVNIASLEGLGAVYSALKEIAPPVQGMLVNIARGTEQLETLRFEALNPTFLLTVTKPGAKN